MSEHTDSNSGAPAQQAGLQSADEHHPSTAADAPVFKRPTPSISTLLSSVPPLHGKLPPLRSSIDGAVGSIHQPTGHLQPLAHTAAPTVPAHPPAQQFLSQQQPQQQQQQLPALQSVKQGARFDCPESPEQQQQQQQHQQQQQQVYVQDPLGKDAVQMLQASANPQQPQDQQLEPPGEQQQQPPKQSWTGVFQQPRQFFLRFSQLRNSTVDTGDASADWQQQHQQQQQQESGHEQQQQQQQQQHWWQRPSRLTQRKSSAIPVESLQPDAAAAALAPDQPSNSSTNSRASSSRSWPARRLQLLQLLDSPITNWVLIIMSLFVIFQEDFKYAVLPPPADLWFESITLALLITFLVEIGLSCLVRPGFFLSFYFWLDTVAVASLCFELPALRAVLLLGETQDYINLNNEDSYLMAAGAQALVSSKAGRAAKMVRLFRQLQLIKLFKQLELRQRLKKVLAEGTVAPDGLTAAQAEVLTKYKHSESRVGQRLSDLTMKRVITGILAMLIVLPALEITSGVNGSTASLSLGGLEMLHMQALTGGGNSTAFNSSLQAFKRNIEYKLAGRTTGGILRLVLANTTHVSNPAYNSVGAKVAPSGSATKQQTHKEWRRYLEMQAAYFQSYLCPASSPLAATALETAPLADAALVGTSQAGPYVVLDASTAATAAAASAAGGGGGGGDGGGVDAAALLQGFGCERMQSFILLDIKWSLQAQSVYGIARTLFLVCLLGLGSYLIHSDTYRLVLQPVQRMVERVREMAEDPLMLAAVRNQPALSPGSGETPKDGSSARNSKGPDNADKAFTARASTAMAAPSGSSDGSKGPKIRFWPSVRVHAVTEGLEPSSPTVTAKTRPSTQLFLGTSDDHQQQQLQDASMPGGAVVPRRARASSLQMAAMQAKRISAHLAAGVHAAGRAADRLRVQLVQRASAIKQLLVVDETEQETSSGQYETRLLEQSIYKICALLAVGFGDAGAEVIAENIKKEGDLNPCMPGKKTVAVFGFCDIRRFTDTTEVLQEGVMEFVNVIAHLVHGAVAARGGAANKNIGDAFLLVWKLPKGLDDRDVSLLSSGGAHAAGAAAASPHSQLSLQSPTKAMRTATLNWPALAEEEDGQGTSSNNSSPRQHMSLPGATHSPRSSSPGLIRPASQGQLATEQEISHMLQQQHAQLTFKRAASGIMDSVQLPGTHKRHSGNPSTLSASGGGSLLSSGDGGHQVEGSGLSSSGLKRAMLSIKSVTATPLSAAAKASIINTIADSALASFVVIQVAITVSRVLKAYSNRPDLNARMPGFRVQMGFGLHVGWAIEGAIGSEYKIDASYLSPNVNLASRLEAATKQYSVPMLLSKDFVDCLSPGVRAKVRQIDCVTVKGSNQPLGLFCYDLDLAAAQSELAAIAAAGGGTCGSISGGSSAARMSSRISAARGLPAAAAAGVAAAGAGDVVVAQDGTAGGLPAVGRIRPSLAVLPDAASAARSSVVLSAAANAWGSEDQTGPDPAELLLSLDFDDDWTNNPVVSRSWAITWDFKEAFDEAFDDYLAGRWPQAREAFEDLLHARTAPDGSALEDPPTQTLLSFMAGHGYVAPEGWDGVRELTEK